MKKWLIPLLTFILVLSSSMCAFASSSDIYDTLPSLPTDRQYKTYYVIYDNGKGEIFSYGTNTNHLYYDASSIWHNTVAGSIWVEQYHLVDNAWVKTSYTSAPSSETALVCYSNKLIYTNFDIMDKTGTVVFQKAPTLPERVLKVGATELQVQLPRLGGTMKVLALCGVGCLALLISLPVLLKVFYRFRARY